MVIFRKILSGLLVISIFLFAEGGEEGQPLKKISSPVQKTEIIKAMNPKENLNFSMESSVAKSIVMEGTGRGTVIDTLLTEGFEGAFPPTGWDTLHLSGSSDWIQTGGGGQHSGNYSAEVQYGTNVDVWLVSKRIDLSSVTSCTLSFYQRGDWTSSYNYWGILVSTSSQTNTSTFVEVQEVGPVSTWSDTFVDLSSYCGEDTLYIAFRYNENNGTNWWIDDVLITSFNSSPNIPTLVRIFDNAIYNAWYQGVTFYLCTLSVASTDPQGDDIQYQLVWDTDPQFGSLDSWTTGSHPSGNTATTAVRLGYITQAETLYYWKAKARDPSGTNEWSGWSETRSFVMDMEIGTDYPYWYQVAGPQFEQCERESVKVVDDSVLISEYETTIDEGFEGSFLPAGWDTLNRGESSNEWSRASDRVYSGSYSVKISFDSKDTVDVWLVTDTLNLSSVASCTLSFWGQDNYASDYSYHGIWASTISQTDTNTFSEVQQINATAEDTWEKSTVNLSSYVGNSSVYVAFRYKEINGTEWWVDNITVKSVYTNLPGGGYLLSPPIVYQDLKTEDYNRNSWDGVKWTKSRASDSIGMQIEYKHNGPWTLVPDNAIGAQGGDSNSTGFFDLDTNFCTVDLSNLTPNTYDTLRIKALFGKGTTKASSNPALYMWAMGNTKSNVTFVSPTDRPLVFALNRNQPNPFATSTEISYQLAREANVELKVFDIMGRSVITLVKGVQKAGSYSIPWRGSDKNGKSLPSGVYFLRMKATAFKATQKIVLIR